MAGTSGNPVERGAAGRIPAGPVTLSVFVPVPTGGRRDMRHERWVQSGVERVLDRPDPCVAALEAVLEPFAVAVSVFEVEEDGIPQGWRVEAFCAQAPDPDLLAAALDGAEPFCPAGVPALELRAVPQVDWVAETQARFPPIREGRIFVRESDYAGPVPGGTSVLTIDAATAFGTGRHGTTRGCLRALQDILRRGRPRRSLDLGSGTGILALAVARLAPAAPVLASDLDPEAVRVTRNNARRNGMGGRIEAVCSAGLEAAALRRRGPFDLVLANILARPLVGMSRALARAVAPGGWLILSGLLPHQARWVLTAYRRQGLVLCRVMQIEGWMTLVLRRRVAAAMQDGQACGPARP